MPTQRRIHLAFKTASVTRDLPDVTASNAAAAMTKRMAFLPYENVLARIFLALWGAILTETQKRA